MREDKIILAVDLGTSGMKVALITVGGKVLGWECEPVRLILTPDGGAEQSPDELWQAFLTAAGRLLRRAPEAARNVAAVCCSTQGEGTVAVDRAGSAWATPCCGWTCAARRFCANNCAAGSTLTARTSSKCCALCG
jgi:xylulokinase